MSDPLALVIAALGSVVGALTFVFGLYIKAQDRAYAEMVRVYEERLKDLAQSYEPRIQDMRAERDRVLAVNEQNEKNVVAVLGVIRTGVEGLGGSMQAQSQTILTLQRLLERAAEDVRTRDDRDDVRERDERQSARERDEREPRGRR